MVCQGSFHFCHEYDSNLCLTSHLFSSQFLGTWSKRSKHINGRRFLGKDTHLIEYDFDSEAEWEEDEEGEECKSDDDDDDAEELGSEQEEEVKCTFVLSLVADISSDKSPIANMSPTLPTTG